LVPLPPHLVEGMNFGRLVAEARGERTIRELAAELEESPSTLHKVEKGQMPKVELFLKLLVWLNVLDAKIAERLMEYAQ
jgi:ribosome-binding protein aMBF1 (putative translation factor)